MNKVKVKNVSSYKISLILPGARYRRDLNPGQETILPPDVFEEFNFDVGCMNLVKHGYLKTTIEGNDTENTIELSVQAPDNADLDVVKLLKEDSVAELGKVLKDAPVALKEKIAETAIKHSILDGPRAKLIEVHCGVDILKAATLQRAMTN